MAAANEVEGDPGEMAKATDYRDGYSISVSGSIVYAGVVMQGDEGGGKYDDGLGMTHLMPCGSLRAPGPEKWNGRASVRFDARRNDLARG